MASHSQRENLICNINDVFPKTKNWKVLIQVLEMKKGGISKTGPNPTKYKNYLFIDMTGTFVSAICFGTDVAYFESLLLPYKRYYISDVYVKPARPGYEVGDYKFSWTLYSTAVVQPLDENVPPQIPYDFQFKKFSEMFRYADLETPINVKALVLKAFARKKVGEDLYGRDLIVQDFIVVDAENIPMIMRLWKEKLNEYADVLSDGLPEPIFFVGMNMKVTTFNGLSLSSRLNSVFLRDPLVNEIAALKEWYALNKEDVDCLVPNEAYRDTDRLLRMPSPTDIMHIADAVAALEDIKAAWIAGKLRLIPGQDKYWYVACKHCQKALKNDHQNEKPCPSCEMTNPVRLKCHIGVMITDATGTVYAEVYSPDAELLIPFTANTLKKAEEEGKSVTAELESALENKHVVCYMKYFDMLFRGAVTRKYPLTKIYFYEDVFPTVDCVSKEPTSEGASTGMIRSKEIVDLSKDDEDNVQFFTPSTKVLIEEISASTEDSTCDMSAPSGCKRVLYFGDVPKATTIVKIEPPEDTNMQQTTVTGSWIDESHVKMTR